MVNWHDWAIGDRNAVMETFVEHLLDPRTYRTTFTEDDVDYDSAQEVADMADDIRYLCDIPEIAYPSLERALEKIAYDGNGRWSIFDGIQSDLELRPQHFHHAKKILLANHHTIQGYNEYLLCLLEVFDFFNERERIHLLKILEKRRNPLVDLLSAIHNIITGIVAKGIDLGKFLIRMDPLPSFDIEDVKSKIIEFGSLLSDLAQVIPEFQVFRSKRMKRPDVYQALFQHAIQLQQYPPFREICIDDNTLTEALNEHLGTIVYYRFKDNISREIQKDPKRQEDAFLPFKSSLFFFEDLLKISRGFRSILNFKSDLESDYFQALHKSMKQLKDFSQNMYYLPVRIAAKKILETFSKQMDAAEKTYSTLKIYMESKKDTVSIIGPFGTEMEHTMELYSRISSKLRLLGYQPRFIPGDYNGTVNAILFDIFVNMSAGIICLYKPSKSSGHVDEVARLLERRISPPVALISPCRFPTTTQIEGISRNKQMNVFCFKEGMGGFKNCPKKIVCALKSRCKKENYPVESIEIAINKAISWMKKSAH